MTFPITEYPLCITHLDGSGLKTEKSKLLNKLEELQDGFTETPIPLIDVTLIDDGLLIHSLLYAIEKIRSYGNLARTLLAHVCGKGGNEIHLLCYTYHPMSLKESERKLRGARKGCQKLLQNGIFKDQLAICLLKEWQEDHYGSILANKTLILSHGGNFLQFTLIELSWKMYV